MKYLFINGSPNKNGNTVSLANTLLQGKAFETIHLVDYKIYSYGQEYSDDQFEEVISKMKKADTIVLGSPLYWHSMSGAVRNLLDRSYGTISEETFQGKNLFFIFQGASPTKEQLAAGEYTIGRYATLYGMTYKGMITNRSEAEQFANDILSIRMSRGLL
ncbi:MAG: NAD(P)H-dependent oxidoreductase [Lachnospiraceae bacterium]|nr:NAD(P)H-dependent oxidoreductase [Lachnospiraceae bacterium]